MPGRKGHLGESGWSRSDSRGLPPSLTVNQRTGNTPTEYTATQEIEFTPGFESGASDEFLAYLSNENSAGSLGVDGSGGGYRYGFNGKENDNEVKGEGNSLDFGARIYDTRIGRWLSTDPLQVKYPGITPYHFTANNPINFIDPDGKDTIKFTKHVTIFPVKYGLGGMKVGGGSQTSYSVTVIQAPGEDKFFYDVTTTVYQATGNPITGIKSTEFFPNTAGKATGVTSSNLGLMGEVPDNDSRALAKLAPKSLVAILETKDPEKYRGLRTAQAYLALENSVDNAFSTVTEIALMAEGGIGLYRAGSWKVEDIISKNLRVQKQVAEHTIGGPRLSTNSFLHNTEDAKSVLDAAHNGDASILSINPSQNRVYVKYKKVTGFYNDNGNIIPTNKFLIKGSKSSTVVPIHPKTKTYK